MGKHQNKCSFQLKWLQKYVWVKHTQNPQKAYCTACLKNIDIAQMGESALVSHSKGAKHIKNQQVKSSLTTCGLAFVWQEGQINVKKESSVTSVDVNNNDKAVDIPPLTSEMDEISVPPPPTTNSSDSQPV